MGVRISINSNANWKVGSPVFVHFGGKLVLVAECHIYSRTMHSTKHCVRAAQAVELEEERSVL